MQTQEEPSSNESQTELEIRKTLETRKLALEIAELERPWWKRPAYILGALPTLLAIIALSVGFLNGFFSAQLTKLENQRHDLEAQIKEFEGTKGLLVAQNEQLQRELSMKQDTLKRIQEIIPQVQEIADSMERINNDTSNIVIQGAPCDRAEMKLALQSISRGRLNDMLLEMAAITGGEKKPATQESSFSEFKQK